MLTFLLASKSHQPSVFISTNLLTLELNPSEQHCLLRFFTSDFKFYFLLLEKKTHLIDFSLKFKKNKILHPAYELVNLGKKYSPIFIINLGL